MAVDTETVRRVARLARIAVDEAELAPLAGELNGILAWVEQLNEVDVDRVEPMTSVTPMRLRRRPDEVTDGNRRNDVLRNAPDARAGFYTVPKVVE
jgi:aspartyl-tRNA(Asn)/glutamyl-tRNA(Gln) amidotransferase subunit C